MNDTPHVSHCFSGRHFGPPHDVEHASCLRFFGVNVIPHFTHCLSDSQRVLRLAYRHVEQAANFRFPVCSNSDPHFSQAVSVTSLT